MLKRIFMEFLCAVVCAAPIGYSRILENMGYSPSADPIEIVELVIPTEWGAVYENYNEMQKQGGFDLEPYKGQTCTRYTYDIPDLFARGNVLVVDGEIIGGDICSITLDGIMLPLEKDKLK